MGRTLTNNLGMNYSIETALNEAGTEFHMLEPNSINSYGVEITKVSRAPISKNRQRRKGTTTDLDSSVEFEHDVTLASLLDFLEGFAFVTAKNGDLLMKVNSIAVGGEITLANAVTAGQEDRLLSSAEFSTLLYLRGAKLPDNQGMFVLSDASAVAGTAVTVAGTTAEETPANARLELAGLRVNSGLTGTWDATSNRLTITSGVAGLNWTTLGLTPGQMVCIGSRNALGEVQNAFTVGGEANQGSGFGRVVGLSETVLVLDKVDASMQNAVSMGSSLDILFGLFIRNVSIDDPDFLERSFQFEVEMPNLGANGATEYQYAKGNYCNSAAFSLPLTDKATVTYGFIGTDTENPTATRKAGGANAIPPLGTEAFNTSTDIARIRVQNVDETGLSTNFKSLTVTLNNNVSAEKVLATLGAKYLNTGNFEVDIEAQMVFTSGGVIAAIRNNDTVTMDFAIRNDDGGMIVDIPAMTLGGGDREYPENESVLINTTAEAFEDPILGTSLGISVLPVML